MTSKAISGRMPAVKIEYDKNGRRALKDFGTDAYAARRFYVAKLKSKHNPTVKKSP